MNPAYMDYLAGVLTGMEKAKYVLYDSLKNPKIFTNPAWPHSQWVSASKHFTRYSAEWYHVYNGIEKARVVHMKRNRPESRRYSEHPFRMMVSIAKDIQDELGKEKPVEVILHKAPFKQFVLMNCYGSIRCFVNEGHKGWVKVTTRKVRLTARIRNFCTRSPLRKPPIMSITLWPNGRITKGTEWNSQI